MNQPAGFIELPPTPVELDPLVVDLDGTLIRTDLLLETALSFVAKHPFQAWKLVAWALAGKHVLKHKIAALIEVDAATLPYNPHVMTYLHATRGSRKIYLASASNEKYVEQICNHVGLFDGWLGSDTSTNNSKDAKVAKLSAKFSTERFDYIGNSRDDIPVWRAATSAIAVNVSPSVRAALVKIKPDAVFLSQADPSVMPWKPYIKMLRPHQWAKNTLVFVPLLTSHTFSLVAVFTALCAFVSFSLCASSVYILNDLIDISADRAHPTKRSRPFASGSIPILNGALVGAVLLIAAFALALALSPKFLAALAVYFAVTNAYSFVLKRKLMIDVVTLAGLYSMRVIAGSYALSIPISDWLLAFAVFIFLCLALIKRHSEMAMRFDANLPDPTNRGYRSSDLSALISLAAAAGYSAVILFSLYISNPLVNALYKHPHRLYFICPLLLYWVSRTVMISHRHEMHDDPIVFALRDRVSLITAGLIFAVGLTAL